MIKKFTTRELLFIALMGTMLLVVNFAIGGVVIGATGIPGASGFVTGITNGIMIAFVALIVRKFGTITLAALMYGLLSLPTPMAGGPPGFLPKVAIIFLAALLADIIISACKFRKWGFFLSLLFVYPINVYVEWKVLDYFGMPGADKLRNALFIITIVFIVLAAVGILIGFYLYEKLKNKRIVRQITA